MTESVNCRLTVSDHGQLVDRAESVFDLAWRFGHCRDATSRMHKAIIVTPDEAERRIVNSIMLDSGQTDEMSGKQQQEFVATDAIRKKNY